MFAILNHNALFADEIHAGDMTVQVDPHTGPVEPGRNLLDMGGFSGAVVPLDENPAVVNKSSQNGQGGWRIKEVAIIPSLGRALLPH